MNYSSLTFDKVESLLIWVLAMFDEEGQYKRDWPRNSCQTVNHNVCPFKTIIDVICCLVEVLAEVESLVIFGRHIEEVGDICSGVSQLNSFGCC